MSQLAISAKKFYPFGVCDVSELIFSQRLSSISSIQFKLEILFLFFTKDPHKFHRKSVALFSCLFILFNSRFRLYQHTQAGYLEFGLAPGWRVVASLSLCLAPRRSRRLGIILA